MMKWEYAWRLLGIMVVVSSSVLVFCNFIYLTYLFSEGQFLFPLGESTYLNIINVVSHFVGILLITALSIVLVCIVQEWWFDIK